MKKGRIHYEKFFNKWKTLTEIRLYQGERMGFFANMKSRKSWKMGKRHAENGSFDKALVFFDDAAKMATDQKLIYENRLWHSLVMTINYSKSGKLEDAKGSYAKFVDSLQSFKAECLKAPGVGPVARFNTSSDLISAFVKRYDKYISPARSALK